MLLNLTGKHLIAGNWESNQDVFSSDPYHEPSHNFSVGTAANVDAAVKAAEEAFWTYGWSSRKVRAGFLRAIVDEIDLRGSQITQIGSQETGCLKEGCKESVEERLDNCACLQIILKRGIISIYAMTLPCQTAYLYLVLI